MNKIAERLAAVHTHTHTHTHTHNSIKENKKNEYIIKDI